LLDFANTKTLDPRITFTRASTATFYDGKTVAKAEENLFISSQSFDDGAWTKNAVTVTANSTTAPDGTTTAETLTDTVSTSVHRLERSATFLTGSWVFSIFAKADTGSWLHLRNNLAGAGVWFDLSTGSLGTQSSGYVGTITSAGNGWYRCSVVSSAAVGSGLGISMANADAVASYTGTGANIFIWGAQLEIRSSVTAYTATTTAPITNYIPALQTAASGVARFEHNPTTGESLGLEIEEQRTNLILQSEDFSTTWTNANSSEQTNVIVSPDGTLTGDKLVEDTSTASHDVRQLTSTLTDGVSYTFSVYAKAAGRNLHITYTINTAGHSAVFDLTSGTVSSVTASITPSITSVGNGWYRCTVTATKVTTGTTIIRVSTHSGVLSYTGDGYSGIYIWGAQLEAGAFATSYIPTTTAQVTRSADSASMTGSNFSSWYRADEGTLYADFVTPVASTLHVPVALAQGVTGFTDTVLIWGDAASQFYVLANNSVQAQIDGGTPTANTQLKVSGAYKVNDFALSLNGGTVATDASGIVPVGVNTMIIGNWSNPAAARYLSGTIKKLAYYPKRLQNSELVGLTTV
jgi:hypothetical protein